jgi:hypothetical protein
MVIFSEVLSKKSPYARTCLKGEDTEIIIRHRTRIQCRSFLLPLDLSLPCFPLKYDFNELRMPFALSNDFRRPYSKSPGDGPDVPA